MNAKQLDNPEGLLVPTSGKEPAHSDVVPKHSPLPWTFKASSNTKNGHGWRDIVFPSQFGPAYLGEALEPDARYICTACNAFPELSAKAALLEEVAGALRDLEALPVDDEGNRTIPAGFLDHARSLLSRLPKKAG